MTTADLRGVCADILDGLGSLTYSQQNVYTHGRSRRLHAGADLLRYSRDLEYGDPDDLRSEIDDLQWRLDQAPSNSDIDAAAAEARAEVQYALDRAEKVLTQVRAWAASDDAPQALRDAIATYDRG